MSYSYERQIRNLQLFISSIANEGCVYAPFDTCGKDAGQTICRSCKAKEILTEGPVVYDVKQSYPVKRSCSQEITTYGLMESPERVGLDQKKDEGLNPNMSGMKL